MSDSVTIVDATPAPPLAPAVAKSASVVAAKTTPPAPAASFDSGKDKLKDIHYDAVDELLTRKTELNALLTELKSMGAEPKDLLSTLNAITAIDSKLLDLQYAKAQPAVVDTMANRPAFTIILTNPDGTRRYAGQTIEVPSEKTK